MNPGERAEIPSKEESKPQAVNHHLRYWMLLVDIAAFVWLSAFIVSLLSYLDVFANVAPRILEVTDTITLLVLPLFAADLTLKYRLSKSPKKFLKKHWMSLIILLPYFRIFKVLSVLHVAGFARLGKIPRAWSALWYSIKAVYKFLKLSRK